MQKSQVVLCLRCTCRGHQDMQNRTMTYSTSSLRMSKITTTAAEHDSLNFIFSYLRLEDTKYPRSTSLCFLASWKSLRKCLLTAPKVKSTEHACACLLKAATQRRRGEFSWYRVRLVGSGWRWPLEAARVGPVRNLMLGALTVIAV